MIYYDRLAKLGVSLELQRKLRRAYAALEGAKQWLSATESDMMAVLAEIGEQFVVVPQNDEGNFVVDTVPAREMESYLTFIRDDTSELLPASTDRQQAINAAAQSAILEHEAIIATLRGQIKQ